MSEYKREIWNKAPENVAEIRNFADLTATMLGEELQGYKGDDRVRQCHLLLNKYPWAYCFALELALCMPDLMAVGWLYNIMDAYYSNPEALAQMRSFLIPRMDSIQSTQVAAHHIANSRFHLPSARNWLKAKRPLLWKCLYAKYCKEEKAFPGLQNILDVAARLFIRINGSDLTESQIIFYLNHDTQEKPGSMADRIKANFLANVLAIGAKEKSAPPDLGFPAVEDGQGNQKHPELDILTVVWGKKYVERWSRFNAPSLLAPDNLPALAKMTAARLVFYTTQADKKLIMATPAYQSLRALFPVRFVLIDKFFQTPQGRAAGLLGTKYLGMTFAHNDAIRRAAREGNKIFLNFPDAVWQNGFFRHIAELLKKGKNYLFAYSGPYSELEKAEKFLSEVVKDGILSLSNAQIRSIFSKSRHTFSRLFYLDSPVRYSGPMMRMTRVKNGGDVVHFAHFTPLLFRAEARLLPGDKVIDGVLPFSPLVKADEVEIIRGNHDYAYLSLSPASQEDWTMRCNSYSPQEFSLKFRKLKSFWDRIFISLSSRFYGENELAEEDWQESEKKAQVDIEEILNSSSTNEPTPALEMFLKGPKQFLYEQTQYAMDKNDV